MAYAAALTGHSLGATMWNSSLPLSAYNALGFDRLKRCWCNKSTWKLRLI